ncbi:putative transposase IS891/IS1136/IS1341 family [Rippkaea orientalis PCC 8801]|uniref:Putative transposase IS891/IS1136/IS1341 family n=1 Tax=Rippkaea orientalis (strain PCC 8801 / RF-1) TaxID=41431 RepID=B7JZ02_RIPO1|nr:RNA-guided endonuclease TnpB family protein [Rippkaea orientalis]ACK66079.1 putative transposase IS891/IS1136/IS1341 family [Rippkaea orientalis PCC 8801]
MITRRVTFRLYPSKSQSAKLFEARRLHAYLYNACVEDRKTSYQKFGKSVGYFDQQAALVPFKGCWPEYKSLNHGSLQATVKRVDFAFQRFFKGLGGYPKFRSIRQYSGWTYPDARQGFRVHSIGENGYLELRDLGIQVQMRGKARQWGTPSTCTIVYRHGNWYASITVKCEEILRETGTGAIGIDFGTLAAIALSDGTKIENPRFLANAKEKIKRASKQKRRKKAPNHKKRVRGSKRWKKASKKVAKLQRKVASQRQDWAHKVSTQIVSCNSMVATEKLNIKGMTCKAKKGKRKRQKSGLNRSILDVGWGMTRDMIEYKLSECNGVFVEVPTQKVKPSQTCPKCGHQEKKTLEQRIHECKQCGYTNDRDVASAEVMLSWALGTSVPNRGGESSTEKPTVKSCGGFQQLASVKRQKLQSQRSGLE